MEKINLTQDEKIKAAHALNLCTVSVSQIVDYDDIHILEQEYEAILNNLNLEHMPHDEALLDILKQLLDVITFFRIQEGDKKMIEMRYKQKMKNAIWNAVPNIGMIATGGTPISIAISLASQIGIGYMNYRRTKAENELDKTEQQWKLQRSAMEQFNGLQRELFNTAWRLADAYNFNDELRLSERQIKHYDSILMDSNLLRRFDRLDSIKDNFTAYPTFWYQMGNTANQIYRSNDIQIPEDTKKDFKEKASECFEKYWEINKYPLLREDQIASSCALEYSDLLLEDGKKDQAVDFIDKAVKYAGRAWDAIQLCAMGYMKARQPNKAIPLLDILVNEKYNTSVNAQFLSGLYIGDYAETKNKDLKYKYDVLQAKVDNIGNLLPWPGDNEDNEVIIAKHYENQRQTLLVRLVLILDEFENKYTVLFNKLLPGPDPYKEYPDEYYEEANKEKRIEEMERVFNVTEENAKYQDAMSSNTFMYNYVDLFNQMLESIKKINIFDLECIVNLCREDIFKNSNILNGVYNKIQKNEFNLEDYKTLQKITSKNARKEIFEALFDQCKKSIAEMNTMQDFSRANSDLSSFCFDEQIQWPNLREQQNLPIIQKNALIGYDVLGKELENASKDVELTKKMKETISSSIKDAIDPKGSTKILLKGDEEFNDYFNNKNLSKLKYRKSDTVGVIIQRHFVSVFTPNVDILLTRTGVIMHNDGKVIGWSGYSGGKVINEQLIIGGCKYSNSDIDLKKLNAALNELGHIIERN